jgi:GNAT superfamily N-acetyltransferase
MVDYACETVAEVLDEILPLVYRHNEEISYDITSGDPLDIDVDLYSRLHEHGLLKVFTAREDGQLIGYALFHLAFSMQRKYLKQAHEGGFYVRPEFRRGHVAIKFIAYIARELAKEDCHMVLYSSPAANPKFGELLHLLGYSKVDEVYARRL